jgi:hypothetical protein
MMANAKIYDIQEIKRQKQAIYCWIKCLFLGFAYNLSMKLLTLYYFFL